MKSIYISIITILFCIVLSSSNQDINKVILQASDKNIASQQLTLASKIISDRLETYGIKSIAAPGPGMKQIEIQIDKKVRISEIKDLLTRKGEIGFYETLTINSNANLGCRDSEDQGMVDSIRKYLDKTEKMTDYKLLWSVPNNNALTCLYALKTDKSGNPFIDRKNIESVKASDDNTSESYTIEIKFKPESAELWESMTEKSIGKPIAFVIDDKVFYSPVVRDAIKNGQCEISGNFSLKEVNYFLALISHDPLPVTFIIK